LKAKSKRPESIKKAVIEALNNVEDAMKTALKKTTLKDILNAE
jgi:DNA-binding IscR family transcriptional regulator